MNEDRCTSVRLCLGFANLVGIYANGAGDTHTRVRSLYIQVTDVAPACTWKFLHALDQR